MKFTILGSGASMGVPLAGGDWVDCDPLEPKNARTRASLLVQSEKANIIIDTTADVREQLNKVKLNKLDAIFLTHYHQDHVSGIDDLKHFSHYVREPIPLFSNKETIDEMKRIKRYMFDGEYEVYYPFLEGEVVDYYSSFQVEDIKVETFEQDHKVCKTVGYRFGDFAYSVDLYDLDEKALEALKGVKVWVVDACGYPYDPDSNAIPHATKDKLLKWVDIIKPEITYFTVISCKMDYSKMCYELPDNIRPAYDGQIIEL